MGKEKTTEFLSLFKKKKKGFLSLPTRARSSGGKYRRFINNYPKIRRPKSV